MLNVNLVQELGLSESQCVFKIVFNPRFLVIAGEILKYLQTKTAF